MSTPSCNKLHNVYFLHGTETFLIEEFLEKIKQKANASDDSRITLDLEEVPIQRLMEEAQATSLFGDTRLIVAKNATFLTTRKKNKGVAHHEKSLLAYLEDPLPTSVVVIIENTDTLDRRKKVTKALLAQPGAMHFPMLSEKEVMHWIVRHAAKWKVTVETDAAKQIVQLVGKSLLMIHNECTKLVACVGEGGTITLDVVDRLITRTLEHDVFKLTDCMMRKKMTEALSIWRDLLYQSQEPLRILALITRSFRLTLHVKVLEKKQLSDHEMAKVLNVHPYPVKLARNQSLLFSEDDLRSYLYMAVRAEEQIKTGMIDKQVAVERILLHICEKYEKIC